MNRFRTIGLRLAALFRKQATERELDEELAHHLTLEIELNIRRGMTPEQAARAARVAFGSVESTREAHRDARGVRWLEDLVADTRYAVRSLRRNPVLAGAAILTLALGIGANTAIFSAVSAVILRPLPFPGADRLVMLWEENPEKNWHQQTVAPANMFDWREQVPAFADVAGYNSMQGTKTLTGDGPPRILRSSNVTGNLFTLLEVRPALGRVFTWEETWATEAPVAILSDQAWRSEFGADPAILGRTVTLDGSPVQIVGVMPRSFAFPFQDTQLWFPTRFDPTLRDQVWFRRAHWFRAIARVKDGVSLPEAQAQLQTVVRRLQQQYPETNRLMGAGFTPLHRFLVGDTRRPLLLLLGAVAVLLLIACGNVGNLLLVRAAGREREAALRLALGAGRGRLVRLAFTESLVLSAAGGAAGVLLGWWGTGMLSALQPRGMLPVQEIGVSWGVLGYVLLITTACGLLFGLAPALWGARRVPAEVMREGGRSGTSAPQARRWSEALVVGEVALALLLTVGAGLLLRSFWRLTQVNPGFDPRGVLAVQLTLPDTRYDTPEKTDAFIAGLMSGARGLPGVGSAAITSQLPLTGSSWTSDFIADGWSADQTGFEVVHRDVSEDYFSTMRVPVLQGRAISHADRRDSPPVLLINQALADRFFPGQNPVGRRVAFTRTPDSTTVWWTVVGVAGAERTVALGLLPRIEVLTPHTQGNQSRFELLLRTPGDPAELGPAVRQLIASLDPELAIRSMRTMESVRAQSLVQQRFLLILFVIFAATGLALAVIGVYGVMAQMAQGRTREVGIRLALGAVAGQVQWLVVRRGLRLIGLGLALGLIAALIATRAMAALLYQVTPSDPPTFAAVPLLLAVAGLVACWIPALRASRASPALALRAE